MAKGRILPTFSEFMAICTTFILMVFARIFFRVESITHAYHYIGGIFSKSLFEMPKFHSMRNALVVMLLVTIFMVVKWFGREQKYGLGIINKVTNCWVRWFIYYTIIFLKINYFGKEQQFVYF